MVLNSIKMRWERGFTAQAATVGVLGDAEHLPPGSEGSRHSPELSAEDDNAGHTQVFMSGDHTARF